MDTIKAKVTAKDFFLWLGAMVALYVSATSLILLIHQFINVYFPNALDYGASYSGAMRFAIASLVVFFPVYVWLTRMLHEDIRKNLEKKELWVRKWLIFLTLFVAGITMAIDLVMLVNTFLNGDLTTRFALKAVTILVVIGGGFWYYLAELRGTWDVKKKESIGIAAFVSLIVIATICGAFFITGSPQTERLLRFDEQKVSNLQSIQWQVVSYWQQKQKLPTTISDLEDPLTGFVAAKDPQTNTPYTYEATGALSFKLCADFNVPSRDVLSSGKTRAITVSQPTGYDLANENWKHQDGQVCFDRTVDPERFPPITKK
ncbi:MAG: DUF5671 domain-containing protein [Patescibacteria group bacterium]